MTEKDEELLKSFFLANRQEIEDDGFSRQVMRRIPRDLSIWDSMLTALCVIGSVAIVMYSGVLIQVKDCLFDLTGNLVGYLSLTSWLMTNSILTYAVQGVVFIVLLVYICCQERFPIFK